jgi:signal transduction histidine kinase
MRSITAQGVRRLLAPTALIALLVLCPSVSTATSGNVRTVVVLLPGSAAGAPGRVQFESSLRATFVASTRDQIQLRFEALDIARFGDAGSREVLANFLRQKYAGRKPDLLVAVLASALDFALEYRDRIFPGVPIVFTALDEGEINERRLPADAIGVPIRMDLEGTLELALRLQPQTRRVFVIVGRSRFDARWEAVARQRFRPYESRLEFVYLSQLSMDDLLMRVANLPDRSIVQYLHIYEDASGRTFFPAEALKMLAARANAPIYGHSGPYIGNGIVGGRVLSFEREGKNAAGLGLRILAGERPETIARPDVSSSEYAVDWRQLRRWGISETKLPPGSDVRYREPSLWDLYHWQIVGAISLFVFQSALIVALLVQMAHRRKAERDLRLSQVELRSLTGRLLQAQEGESRRIARELHDDLGQGLALLTVEMDLLRQKPPEAGKLAPRLEELLRQTRLLSSSVHELSHQLHPAKLEQLGLAAAIRGLCHEMTRHHGVKLEFTEPQAPSAAIPADVSLCLYRIAQEALANSVKHSGATQVWVELSGTADTISLRIVDNGIGFDPKIVQGKGGLGLASMRERVFPLAGAVVIDSHPAGGTRVSVTVPLSPPASTELSRP